VAILEYLASISDGHSIWKTCTSSLSTNSICRVLLNLGERKSCSRFLHSYFGVVQEAYWWESRLIQTGIRYHDSLNTHISYLGSIIFYDITFYIMVICHLKLARSSSRWQDVLAMVVSSLRASRAALVLNIGLLFSE
jgi:hypothetical protein